MTKKDYEAFASLIKTLSDELKTTEYDAEELLVEFADRAASVFKTDNARFNRERFLAACGIE